MNSKTTLLSLLLFVALNLVCKAQTLIITGGTIASTEKVEIKKPSTKKQQLNGWDVCRKLDTSIFFAKKNTADLKKLIADIKKKSVIKKNKEKSLK